MYKTFVLLRWRNYNFSIISKNQFLFQILAFYSCVSIITMAQITYRFAFEKKKKFITLLAPSSYNIL